MTGRAPWVHPLWERVGDRRVALVWALYGWATLQQNLLLFGRGPLGAYLGRTSLLYPALLACGLALALLGPRPILFAVTSAITLWLQLLTASGVSPRLTFPGAELPVFLSLPLGSLLVWGLWRRRLGEAELTGSLLTLYRLIFVVVMGFATLHKMNADFFTPHLSCASVLSGTLPTWWHTPVASLARFIDPLDVVVDELAMPLLLLLYWPLGLLFTLIFTTGLAMIGPTGFTAVVVSAAAAFVRGRGADSLFAVIRRPYLLVPPLAVVLVTVPSAFHGPTERPWPQYAIHLLVATLLALAACWTMVGDLRRRLGGRADHTPSGAPPTAAERWELPSSRRLRMALAAFGLVLLLNGMSPYLGLKYHFSFSMLSNLRADDERWNSLVMPRWLRLVRRDPFVHVEKVHIVRPSGDRVDGVSELFPALYSPDELVQRLRSHVQRGHVLDLVAVYRGQRYVFVRAGRREDFAILTDRLPRSLLWASVQALGPQPCVH